MRFTLSAADRLLLKTEASLLGVLGDFKVPKERLRWRLK